MPSLGDGRACLGAALAGRANRTGDDDSSRGLEERFARVFELKVRGRRRGRMVVVERLKRPRGRAAMAGDGCARCAGFECF